MRSTQKPRAAVRLAHPDVWVERLERAGFVAEVVSANADVASITSSVLLVGDVEGQTETLLIALRERPHPPRVLVVDAPSERIDALLAAGAADVFEPEVSALRAEGRLEAVARCQWQRQELEFLRRFVDAAPDVVLASDRNHRIVYVNTTPERIGQSVFDFVPAAYHGVLGRSLDRVFVEGCEASHLVEQADVEPAVWWSVRLGPVVERGEITMVAMVARDISEAVRVEHELKATKEQLEQRVAKRTEELEQINSALRAEIVERERLEDELREVASIQKMFASTVIEAQEQERKRVARELHDAIGQVLVALKMDADWIDDKLDGQSELTAVARDLSGKLGHTLDTVRSVIRDLRPPMLDELGVSSALEAYANQLSRRADVDCALMVDAEELPRVAPEVATGIFRIGQEALNNAVRHAAASRVDLTLELRNDEIVLTVHDDGRGIPENALEAQSSVGLMGMRERASLLRGRFTITARQDRGTTICARIPHPRGDSKLAIVAHA